jgi:Hsp70 protein
VSDWILLIDFGASLSRAAVRHPDGRVEPIEVDGATVMPSGVWADATGTLSAGLPAQRQARLSPERWDRAPKRSLGQPSMLLGELEVNVPVAVAAVLTRLTSDVIKRRGAPRQVRLTCPALWDAEQRQALLSAAALAGLGSADGEDGEVQLVDAPTVVGAYLAEHGLLAPAAKVALFDLGGGGLETAVLESGAEGIVVRSLGGIPGLGGEFFDDLIYREVAAQALAGWDPELAGRLWEPPDPAWRRATEGLFREVRRAKEDLSRYQTVHLDTGPLIDTPLTLDRTQVEALLRPQILRSARELAVTIELAGLRPRLLDAIYLIGGGSRMPLVERAVYDITGVRPTLLEEPDVLAAAAGWTPRDRIDRALTPITRSGRGLPALLAARAPEPVGTLNDAALLQPSRPVRGPSWRRRRLLVGVAVLVLLLGGFALRNRASGDDGSRITGAELPAATAGPGPVPSGTATGSGSALPAVTGLVARTNRITVELHWKQVRGAASYRVYRDAGTPLEVVKAVTGTTLGDRPGDGVEHGYVVVAVDGTGRSGPGGSQVRAAAQVPYGDQQDIASAWTAMVPVRPGQRGSAGQTCEAQAGSSDYSTGQIVCDFGDGVRLTILRYASAADRDRRETLLAAEPGVSSAGWHVPLHSGFEFTGRLLTASGPAPSGPWLWWTFDAATSHAMYAEWPGHSVEDLTAWWRQKAPFRR